MRTTLADSGTCAAASFTERQSEGAFILLFAAEPLASEVAGALRSLLTPHVKIAGTQTLCTDALRKETFDLLLLEESVAALDPRTAEALYEAAGTAVIVEVNFGSMKADRIVLATRAALCRRKLDLLQARAAAKVSLRHELTASLTGLLLESQLALRQAGPGVVPALERLVGLAEHVCSQMRADELPPPENEGAINLHHR